MAICITSFTISEDISFIFKAVQQYFVQFKTTHLMANTSDCLHGMIDLLIILESIFIILVGNVLFDHILFYTFLRPPKNPYKHLMLEFHVSEFVSANNSLALLPYFSSVYL